MPRIKKSDLEFDKWGYAKVPFSDLPYGQKFMPGDALTNDDSGFKMKKVQGNGYPDYGSVIGNLCSINVEADEIVLIHKSEI